MRKASSALDQLSFDKNIYSFDVLNTLFTSNIDGLTQQANGEAKWPLRSYIFALSQKFIADCGRIIKPLQVEKLFKLRYGGGWSSEQDANIDLSIKASVAEFDADTFLKRHGCEGPVGRHVFSMIDRFLAARTGDYRPGTIMS